jgi:hypothetical protein
MLPEILDRVFDGSDTNPLFHEIVQWSNEYSENYPENNSPTMTQEQCKVLVEVLVVVLAPLRRCQWLALLRC